MGVPENIDALLVKYDIDQQVLANIAGVTPGAVTGWRKGSRPRKDSVQNMCDYFGITEDDILSDRFGLAAKEHGDFSDHKPDGAIKVEGMTMGFVPLKCRVHAGKPVSMEILDERGDMVLCPQFLLDRDPDIWAAQSEGDCMNRILPEGSIYFVSPNKPHQDGNPEVWTIDGYDTVARRAFKTTKTLLLSPDSTNPDNKDIIITVEDDHYADYNGAIVWYQSNGEFV